MLLANVNPFEKMQQHLSRPTSPWEIATLLLFVVGAISVWAALWVWEQHRRKKTIEISTDRRNLWERLSDAHQLKASQIEFLKTAAQTLQLADPVLLFVDPRCLEQLAASDESHRSNCHDLGRRLFGDAFQTT